MLLKRFSTLVFFIFTLCYFSDSMFASNAEEKMEDSNKGGEKGHGYMGFRVGAYHNSDSGDGNPFLDEELTVIEPIAIFDYNVSDDLGVWTQLSADYVSSASIDRLSKFPQQSGASGDYYFGLDGGVRYKLSEWSRVSGFLSGSVEYDYRSFGLGGSYSKDSQDKNQTVKLSLNGFFDQIDIIRFDGNESEGSGTRRTMTTSVNWYRVIDKKTHGELGATVSFQSGFLETAYNAVVLEDTLTPNPNLVDNLPGTEITENLPSSRTRMAVFGRVRRHFDPGMSVEMGGRIYNDTWGITGLTAEPRFYKWLIDDVLNVRFRYRFYTQTEANDFNEHFLVRKKFRTQDSDLGDYSAHTLGLKFTWQASPTLKFDFGGDFVLRSDGIDQILSSIGLIREF